jgi:hypothetical protein
MKQLCAVCFQPLDQPFRARDERGLIIAGCISAAHTQHVSEMPTDSAAWHLSIHARELRELQRELYGEVALVCEEAA